MNIRTEHECYVGQVNDWENTRLVTLSELNDHIAEQKEFADFKKRILHQHYKFYTIEDYSDRRVNTDLNRFSFCPICGKKIDWKRIKEENRG